MHPTTISDPSYGPKKKKIFHFTFSFVISLQLGYSKSAPVTYQLVLVCSEKCEMENLSFEVTAGL
jgi:hypothetical protein